MSNTMEQKKIKITIGDTSFGKVQNVYVEDLQNVEEGRTKFNTFVDLGHTIFGCCKHLYNYLSDIEYEKIKTSYLYKDFDIFEYDLRKKKFKAYKITLEKEYDISDIEIESLRSNLKSYTNKIIKEVEK